jgi:PAS domain S-box-containing protein
MNFARFPGPARRHLPLALVLFTGTILSFLVFQIRREAARERAQEDFLALASGYHRVLTWELAHHEDVVRSLRDFLLASPDADRTSFSSFARPALNRKPAIRSLKWIPRVPAAMRQVLEAAERTDGNPDFAIQEMGPGGQPSPAGERSVYYPVLHFEPREEHEWLAGFDYASDEVRLRALSRAAGGSLAASEALRLPQEPGAAAVLLVLPVTRTASDEPDGFVAAHVRLESLAEQLLPEHSGFEVELLDPGAAPDRQRLFRRGGTEATEVSATREARFPVELGGRKWSLVIRSNARTSPSSGRFESWGLLLGGLLLTALTAAWVRQRQNYTFTMEQQVRDRTSALTISHQRLEEQVSQRQEAERKLQQSEARFREAFQHAPIGVGLLSREGRWLQVNNALMEMTGFSEKELLDGTIGDLLHPDDAPRELARFAQVLARRDATFALEQRFRHADGSSVWVLHNVSQVRDSEDRLLYFICQILDITDQKEAMEATRQAREVSENIIRSSTDGILAFDCDGRFTVWNSGMEKMTGLRADEALGKPAVEVLPFLADSNRDRAFKRVLSGATVKATDRPFAIPSTGRSGFYEASYSPLHDGTGGIVGGVGVMRDVTEQKKARERLQNFTELLRQRNRELQDFAYVASHDLQEPLRKIRAFGDRLEKRSQDALDEQAKDYLNRMQDASRRMQILISDLLAFSRVSTEAHPFVPVDLGEIAREVLSDLEERILHSGAMVEVGDLPKVEADPTQMRQLLQNLISNALKYQKPGIAPRVEIFSAEHMREEYLPPLESHGCLLYVRDHGIGFDEKYLDRIFTVFQRLHGRAEYEGTGIGLAICRKIVERHHGWITARSTPGEGATFITALPYKQNYP